MGDYMKYIKVADAVRILFDDCTRYVFPTTAEPTTEFIKLDNAIDLLRLYPSADVAPVRHGHWDVREPMPMHDIKGNLSWGNWYVCTGCGFATTAIEGHITQYKYCPNCGARMDGGGDDE